MSARYVLTNTSEWLFNKDPTFTFSDTYKNNVKLFSKIFSTSDILFTKRLCFDKCVNDFKSTNFSLTENACLNSCLHSAESFLYNVNVKLDNIA